MVSQPTSPVDPWRPVTSQRFVATAPRTAGQTGSAGNRIDQLQIHSIFPEFKTRSNSQQFFHDLTN